MTFIDLAIAACLAARSPKLCTIRTLQCIENREKRECLVPSYDVVDNKIVPRKMWICDRATDEEKRKRVNECLR